MDEAEYATRLAFLDEGRLLAPGTRDEILAAYPRPLLEVLSSDRVAVRGAPPDAARPSTTSLSSGPASTSGARRGPGPGSSTPFARRSRASSRPTA